jgi:alpha-L-rhamnosidase
MKYKKCIIITSFCILNSILSATPLLPDQLSCEYLLQPLGIDSKSPRLSWTYINQGRDQFQQAYEIIVSDDLKSINAMKGNSWSTGKIISSRNINIVYNGSTLRSLTRYYWRVRTYNQSGEVSGWSKPTWFETGMMNGTDWSAKWIGDGKQAPLKDEEYYQPDPMPLFRKNFTASKKISSARLYISGLGYYEAWLNGKKIGDHQLDPGWTAYRKQVQYVVHDITEMIKKGNNTAGVMLGNGWWNPLPFKLFGRWDLRNYQQTDRPCLKAEIHLTYADGSTEKINTDESWITAPGPVLKNNVYLGEHYDARKELADWLDLNFVKSNWKNAVLVSGPAGELTRQMQPPIRITRIVKPVSISEIGKDTFLVNMGQNFAGVARIKVKGPAGTKITLRYGEGVFSNGSLNVMTTVSTQIKKGGIKGGPGAPETAWQEDSYTLKGIGLETWSPRFTFHGFQYVEITGWPGKPTQEEIEGLRMNSDLVSRGEFACSNELFNKLHEVIQWTFLSNVFSVQSDCPGREKMGYGADMVVSANSFMYNYDMANFYAKSVRDFANEQRPRGGMTEIAPSTGINDRGYADSTGPLGWQLAFPFLQKQLYEFYGDRRIIEQHYPALQKQIAFLQSQAMDNLFLWDIGDHEALDPKPEPLTASAFYYQHVKIAAEFAGILDKKDDSVRYEHLAANIKRSIVNHFLVPGTGRFDNGTQSAQLFALWHDLSPEKAKSIEQFLKELERHNWHLSTGIFSTQMLFDVLRKNNLNEVAYRVANQRDFPGWGNMLANGATTLWETWAFPETGPSRNHPMFGSIEEWFYRSLLGINAGAPGFEKIIIQPQPAGDLTWARGSYQSVRGTIGSNWKKEADQFIMNISIPVNTQAEIRIPAGQSDKITEAGKPVTISRYEDGYAVVLTGSGNYSFLVTK